MTYKGSKTKNTPIVVLQKVDLFAESFKSPQTKATYTSSLNKFLADTKINLRKAGPKAIQETLIQYVVALKNAGRSYSRQNSYICAVKAYCEAYDIEGINWDKIWKYTSQAVTPHTDVPYSREEIAKMLYKANARARAIILTMVSSGVRVGALPTLRRKDLQEMDGFTGYKIMVYADSPKDRYVTFCTPEARKAIETYFEERKNNRGWQYKKNKRFKFVEGETITDDSPVFRLERAEVLPITAYSAMKILGDLAVSVGIRPHTKKTKRHKTPATHSFRKFANTAFVKAGVKPVVVEMLLGHKTGLQQNYLRLTDEELLSEYVKAIDLLTIGNEEVLRRENERLKVKTGQVEDLKTQLVLTQERQKRQQAELDRISQLQKRREDDLERMSKEFINMSPDEQARLRRDLIAVLQNMTPEIFKKVSEVEMRSIKKEIEEERPRLPETEDGQK